VTTRQAQPEEWLLVVLSGRLAIHADRGAGSRKVVEWRGGDVCGLMPYSRGGAPPGDTVAEEPTEALAIHRDRLPVMTRTCPGVTASLVHAMLDRARHFTSSDDHEEKLVALGRLAAGLAHELNNPASAAASSAQRLPQTVAEVEGAARALAASRLTDAQLRAIDRVHALGTRVVRGDAEQPLERADHEEAMAVWLEAHGLAADFADSLADAGIAIAPLDVLALSLDRAALEPALRWIAAGSLLRSLASDIDASTSRVSTLVAAVTRFTYVDRAPTAGSLDVRPGLRDTLAVLASKTRTGPVDVTVDLPADLPRVSGYGGELNQVWFNVIDNALDAVAGPGHVAVTARLERDRVVVRVVDDGPGIPSESVGRIFDPFYTTKAVGAGTGLGLAIARRLVQRHGGEIAVDSRPGRTEFRVSLPALEP